MWCVGERMKKKYTTLWEIEKPYNDKLEKKSGVIVAIVNFLILLTGAIICSIIIQLGDFSGLGSVLLFGYGIGVFAMFATVIITIRYAKIRID